MLRHLRIVLLHFVGSNFVFSQIIEPYRATKEATRWPRKSHVCLWCINRDVSKILGNVQGYLLLVIVFDLQNHQAENLTQSSRMDYHASELRCHLLKLPR